MYLLVVILIANLFLYESIGCFYESNSRFFYCPKSKLYYNEVDGAFYRYSIDVETNFVPVYPPVPTEAFIEKEVTSIASVADDIDSATRKPVVLSISNLNSQKSKTKIKKDLLAPAVILAPPRKLPDDVTKWEVRNAEVMNNPPASESGGNNDTDAQIAGSAVCLLCRRQFPSKAVLIRHEKESKLHAENLAKAQFTKDSSSVSEYRDRASERRELHGQSEIPEDLTVRRKRSRSRSRDRKPYPRTEGAVAPRSTDDALKNAVFEDEANPGNQMLRKLGLLYVS